MSRANSKFQVASTYVGYIKKLLNPTLTELIFPSLTLEFNININIKETGIYIIAWVFFKLRLRR